MSLDPEKLRAKAADAQKRNAKSAETKQHKLQAEYSQKLKTGRTKVRKDLKDYLARIEREIEEAADSGNLSVTYTRTDFDSLHYRNDFSENRLRYDLAMYELEYIEWYFTRQGLTVKSSAYTGTEYDSDGGFSDGICHPRFTISWDDK